MHGVPAPPMATSPRFSGSNELSVSLHRRRHSSPDKLPSKGFVEAINREGKFGLSAKQQTIVYENDNTINKPRKSPRKSPSRIEEFYVNELCNDFNIDGTVAESSFTVPCMTEPILPPDDEEPRPVSSRLRPDSPRSPFKSTRSATLGRSFLSSVGIQVSFLISVGIQVSFLSSVGIHVFHQFCRYTSEFPQFCRHTSEFPQFCRYTYMCFLSSVGIQVSFLSSVGIQVSFLSSVGIHVFPQLCRYTSEFPQFCRYTCVSSVL